MTFMRVGVCAMAALIAGVSVLAASAAWAAWAAEARPQVNPPAPTSKAREVMRQPFKDLNVVRDAIPEALTKAKVAPYARPQGESCEAVIAEINLLDGALGRDLDVEEESDDSLSKKLSNETFNLARGALSGLIPYRGILRRVTGAEKHAREINEALLAGAVRRSYLKGYGEKLGCEYPGAPKRDGVPAAA